MYFIDRIKKILKWIPIIWKDRDFDYIFLLEVIRFKLKSMEEFFNSKYAMSMNSNKRAEEIHKCILILNRIIDDDYIEIAFKHHNKKWGELNFKNNKFSCPNANTEEEIKQEHKERFRLYKHSDILLDQDIDYFFKLLRKHFRSWWD